MKKKKYILEMTEERMLELTAFLDEGEDFIAPVEEREFCPICKSEVVNDKCTFSEYHNQYIKDARSKTVVF